MINVKFNNITEYQKYIYWKYKHIFNTIEYTQFFENEYTNPSSIFISYFNKHNKYYLIKQYMYLSLILLMIGILLFIAEMNNLPLDYNVHLLLSVFIIFCSCCFIAYAIEKTLVINYTVLLSYISDSISK